MLSYAKLIRDFWASGKQVHVVVGGGPPARRLIGLLSEVGAGKALQDIIGIEVSRLNAKLLAYSLIGLGVRARYVEELSASLILEDEILVMGGLTPGQSTTTVAALLAELIKADKLVVATDVDGIYTSDPKLNPQAKKLDVVTPQELMEILRQKHEPGGYQLIDRTALEIIARSN
ncbi:MAG: UMP kinase, partial [Thermoprotei archaeon]